MMLRQGFSMFSMTLLATRMLWNSVSTSGVPRTRRSTSLAFSGLPRSTRELGVLGRKMPPASHRVGLSRLGNCSRTRPLRHPGRQAAMLLVSLPHALRL